MGNDEKKMEIGKCLIVLFGAYNEVVEPHIQKLYISCLMPYPLDEIKGALHTAVKTIKKLPTIAHLIELLEPSEADLAMMASSEAGRLIKSVTANYPYIMEGDEISRYLVETRFNLERLSDMPHEQFHFEIKKFEEAYIKAKKSKAVQEVIKLSDGGKHNVIKSLAEKFTPQKNKQLNGGK